MHVCRSTSQRLAFRRFCSTAYARFAHFHHLAHCSRAGNQLSESIFWTTYDSKHGASFFLGIVGHRHMAGKAALPFQVCPRRNAQDTREISVCITKVTQNKAHKKTDRKAKTGTKCTQTVTYLILAKHTCKQHTRKGTQGRMHKKRYARKDTHEKNGPKRFRHDDAKW